MSIRGSNFENQHPFASDHALVWERCMPDGLLYGVYMSFTSTLFTLGTGFMLVAGRMIEITASENISISPGSGYARVYVAIDTGGTATENSFDQVSFGVDYAANLDSFAELTQGEININQGAAVYQAEVAVLAINSSGVTAIERQMELVSPGAGTGAFAAIAVTYPAGSTVTVTDGKITYTAPNTNGAALFIIPYAATWIVTATDGTETATESVEITTEGQSATVELSYALYLFKTGNECSDVTGGWRLIRNASLKETYIALTPSAGSSAETCTNNTIDLKNFSTIYFEFSGTMNVGTGGTRLFLWAASTQIQSSGVAAPSGAAASLTYAESGELSLLSFDISELTTAYYIGLHLGLGGGVGDGLSDARLRNVYLKQ